METMSEMNWRAARQDATAIPRRAVARIRRGYHASKSDQRRLIVPYPLHEWLHALGAAKYLPVALFWVLIAGSLSTAWLNWSRDPAQRSAKHVTIWLMRSVAAGIWYQGSIWKLPLPVVGAFMHWTSQLAVYTAIPFHATIVRSIFRPGIAFIQPLVYRTEVFLTVSLLLGVGVRLAGVITVLFTLHLWIGLYNDPTEWPWTYVAIICAHGMFDATEAGRSLGLDNLLRGQWSGVFANRQPLLRAYHLVS